MAYKTPRNRKEVMLLPPSLSDYIASDNPVLAIDAYVESLDLEALGFIKPKLPDAAQSGQPAFHPRELLKLYIYGYLNQVRSSRRLEREASRNLELMWLMGELKPSYKTIADFRKHFANGLKQVNKDFMLLCKSLSLFGGEVVAIDGSFFKANASKQSIKLEKQLVSELARIEARIDEYHTVLAQNDQAENKADVGSLHKDPDIQEKLTKLIEKKAEHDAMLASLKDSGEKQFSKTDPDARRLNKNTGSIAGYNIQSVVDEKHKLIAYSEVGNKNDLGQLADLADKAKTELEVEKLKVLTDMGYYKQSDLQHCEESGIDAYVPIPDKNKVIAEQGRSTRIDFHFNIENDNYTCPSGKVLVHQSKSTKNGVLRHIYGSKASICKDCPLKVNCLPKNSKIRKIYRTQFESTVDRHRQKMNDYPDVMKKRSSLVEHPFGTIKTRAGHHHFLVRGFAKVSGEWGLMALCYNFTRVLNIIGMQKFIQYCQERGKLQPI